jgi:hypothetical protein
VFHFIDNKTLAEGTSTVIAVQDAYYLGVLSSKVHVVWALAAGGRLGVGNDPRYTKTRCFDPFPFPTISEPKASRVRDLAEELDAHRKRQITAHPELTITGMYNVLEKLRSNASLSSKEREIHEQGLISLLRKIHDELDVAVSDAYGWPRDLTDEQILQKLVALNVERAEEERCGTVRWLRPDLQQPAHIDAPVAEDAEADDEPIAAVPTSAAVPWPTEHAQQFVVVRERVIAVPHVWGVADVVASFRKAPRARVEAVLETLEFQGDLIPVEGSTQRWLSAATMYA